MDCTIHETAQIIGKRWTLQIILELYKDKKRFNELKASLFGITPKQLSLRLREMEDEGLIEKKIDSSSMPIKCEYFLTDSGRDFISVLTELKRWALKNKIKNSVCNKSDCINCRM